MGKQFSSAVVLAAFYTTSTIVTAGQFVSPACSDNIRGGDSQGAVLSKCGSPSGSYTQNYGGSVEGDVDLSGVSGDVSRGGAVTLHGSGTLANGRIVGQKTAEIWQYSLGKKCKYCQERFMEVTFTNGAVSGVTSK